MTRLTEGGFSNPPLNGNGGQECPPSFSTRKARQDLALLYFVAISLTCPALCRAQPLWRCIVTLRSTVWMKQDLWFISIKITILRNLSNSASQQLFSFLIPYFFALPEIPW